MAGVFPYRPPASPTEYPPTIAEPLQRKSHENCRLVQCLRQHHNRTAIRAAANLQLCENAFCQHRHFWTLLGSTSRWMCNIEQFSFGNKPSPAHGLETPFLYKNGTFQVVSVPKSGSSDVVSISPKQGLILGLTAGPPGNPAFIAQCQ
jgi:hypothetical protein